MSHFKAYFRALIFVTFSVSSASALAQTNDDYYTSDINKAIKAQKRKPLATSKAVKTLPKLSSRQLGSIRIQGAIGATASADKATLSKREIEKLELAKNSENQSKAKASQQVFNISKIPMSHQGAYSDQGFYQNIKGQAEVSARLIP